MTTRGMQWQKAIREVLENAERPLHYAEIAAIIKDENKLASLGATPAQNVSYHLGRMLDNKVRIGRSIVRKCGRGYWARAEVAEIDYEDDDSTGTALQAYGLQWNRSSVDWSLPRGNLFGAQPGGEIIDFADQDGIYMLHNGGEVVYVGKTYTPVAGAGLFGRLRSHHNDPRKTGRWDSFSWFGFKPVDPVNGGLQDPPSEIPIGQFIESIEAILIEGLLPRLNMRSGENVRKAQDSILFFQAETDAAQ